MGLLPVKADGNVVDQKKRILVLNSYHETYIWSDRLMDGVKSVFKPFDDIELFISYMDTKHVSSDLYYEKLAELYAFKFNKMKFDAIVSCDDNALNFLLKYRNDLFPTVPVFFCGINDFDPEILRGTFGYTGVREEYDVSGTVDLMLNLHPKTKEIVTVTDGTTTGQAFLRLIDRAEPEFSDRVSFRKVHNVSPDQLSMTLKSLAPDSLVLWAIYLKTPDGTTLSSKSGVHAVTEVATVPVYCIWDVVGLGVIGGKITSPEYQGQAAAERALLHLQGENSLDLPVTGSPMMYVFDYEQLQTFGIPESVLPENRIIRNRPYSLYREYKHIIWLISGIVVLLLGIIAFLVRYIIMRHSMERKLEAVRGQLAQSRKLEAVGQLAGGIAHDFNNVLASICGAAEVLELSAATRDRKYVNMILSLTDRASQLTAKLLAFGRKGNVVLEPVDLHRTIESTIDILRVSLNRDVIIKPELNAQYSIVMADEAQITNILLNMGINAEHAMAEGGTLSIKTSVVSLDRRACAESGFKLNTGEYLCINICDEGCGIPEDLQDKIFEPFFTTQSQGKGTGLGLASVYGSIVEHGGAINVQSAVGEGADFSILLPLTDERKLPVSGECSHIRGAGQLILVVDDEQLTRNTTSKMLTDLNYRVLLACNGVEAVEVFKEHADEIAVIVMDVVMPKMSGRKAYELIREIDVQVGVIFTSGFTGDEAISEVASYGRTAFLRKPFRTQDLHQRIVSMLSGEWGTAG